MMGILISVTHYFNALSLTDIICKICKIKKNYKSFEKLSSLV